MQNGQFGSEMKSLKNTRKSSLQAKAKRSKQRQRPLQNGQFKSKIKIAKKMRKTTLQANRKCSMQKAVRKNSQYWKTETILKIGKSGRHGKAIAFANWSVWVENEKSQKHAKKFSTSLLELFYAKKS